MVAVDMLTNVYVETNDQKLPIQSHAPANNATEKKAMSSSLHLLSIIVVLFFFEIDQGEVPSFALSS